MTPSLSGSAAELSLELREVLLLPLIDWNVLVFWEGLQARTTATTTSVAIENPLYDIMSNLPDFCPVVRPFSSSIGVIHANR